MTESKLSITSLINLFEKKIENISQEGTSKESVIHHISEQQKKNLMNLLLRKESPYRSRHAVQQSSQGSLKTSESLALQRNRSQASVDPGSNVVMLHGESPTRKNLEETDREKDLEETLKTNQHISESSKTSMTTKPSSITTEKSTSKQELRRQEFVKHKQLEDTASWVQSHHTIRGESRSSHAEESSAKERRMRIELEKRLRLANTRISHLSKQLEEKKKEIFRYKADEKNHIKTEEALRKQTQLNLDLSRQLRQANDKIMALVRRLEAIACNINAEQLNSASKLTLLNQKNDSKPKTYQENEKNKIDLFHVKSKKKQLTLDDVKEEDEIKTTKAEEKKLEAKIKKSASHSGKDLPAPIFSHSFSMSELTKGCHLLPNLHFGLDRPKRKKNYALQCARAGANETAIEKRSRLQMVSTK